MKPQTLLVTITALSLAASIFGQEEQATAPPMQEQPSSTIQESPPATATVETTASPAEKPSPAMKASPAAKMEKSASPAAAKAAAPPAPMASGKKMSVEAAIKENENRWATAHGKAGAATVEGLVADDFLGVNSKGKIQNQRAMLSEMRKDRDTYASATNEKLEVHKYGNNVAVVVGKYREKGTDKNGKAFDRAYYFTDTWVERNGAWKCVASESMLAAK